MEIAEFHIVYNIFDIAYMISPIQNVEFQNLLLLLMKIVHPQSAKFV